MSLPYVPLVWQGKCPCICEAPNHTPLPGNIPRLLQSCLVACLSISLPNSVHTSLIALRILMIIMAKHLLITYYVLGILNTLERLPYLILIVTP